MKVLVTGSQGLVGSEICRALNTHGLRAVGFDKESGEDILDLSALAEASSGCDAVIHCAALLGRPDETAADIMATNLQGTSNVLIAADSVGIGKVVFMSSVDVLGVFKGERAPDFLPLDESHPCYPRTTYGISKYLCEEMCRLHAQAKEVSVVCLRPPGVWDDRTYGWITAQRQARPEFEWDPFWEYGAFIDVRDLAAACLAALDARVSGFHKLLVSSSDITTSGPTSSELVARIHPQVEWRGDTTYDAAPYLALVRDDLAQQVLAWKPMYSWADFVPGQASI